jgi:hypothetical protein
MLQLTNESYNSKHFSPKKPYQDNSKAIVALGIGNSDSRMIIVLNIL